MKENDREEVCRLAALTKGDFDAFGFLYERYHRTLYGFALYLSKNPHEAEELVQYVFVSVWETKTAIDPEKSFRAYLFSIARNRFCDILRKRVTANCYTDYVLSRNEQFTNDFERQMEDSEIGDIIDRLLQQVPERRRLIFKMNRFENLSYKQIAEQLQISENTVDTQIRNVLNFLRKELPKYLKILFLIP